MVTYRSEIDGLRGIAVVPVVLYHAGFHTFFAGGYVGVDIFFVISGYLITSIIVEELEGNKFSLIRFYERRCRRILPALFLILFCSSYFSYYWMLPDQLLEFGQTLISIIYLSSNIFFWWKDDGYFSRIAELNPLVHTWSLAVEEQFYFVFPLLCSFFYKKKRCLITILISVTLLSFFLAQSGGNFQSSQNYHFQLFAQHSYATFYLPIGRVWELLLGSFAAFYLRTRNLCERTDINRNNFLSCLGFILIAISIILFDSRQIHPFPNCYTLVPTIGATMIILYGDKDTFVGYFLSTSPLRWIGLVSYSIYLWHQPLLAFLRLRYSETPNNNQLIIVLIAVCFLSICSYFYVEQPFRTNKRFSCKWIFSLSGIFMLITLLLALFFIRTADNRSQIANNTEDTYLSDLKRYGSMYYTAIAFHMISKMKTFSNNTLTRNKRAVLIGDSYAQDFYNIIREGGYFSGWEIRVYLIHVECQIYIGAENRQNFIAPAHKQRCMNGNDIKYAFPLIREANTIILAGSWRHWSAIRLPTTIKLLNLTEQQQLFVIGSKHFGTVKRMLYMNKSKEYRLKQYGRPQQWFIDVNKILEKTISKSSFVNILRMICTGPDFTCPHFTPEGKLISYDNFHVTKYGALYVGNIIFNKEPLNRLRMTN